MTKRKTIKDIEAELVRVSGQRDANYEKYREAAGRASTAEEALKESRSHFGDLKKRLHDSEAELARLRGYLDRVHEDDVVRDGMVDITDESGTRQVPKRPPPMMRGYSEPMAVTGYDQFGRQKKSTHWTSY